MKVTQAPSNANLSGQDTDLFNFAREFDQFALNTSPDQSEILKQGTLSEPTGFSEESGFEPTLIAENSKDSEPADPTKPCPGKDGERDPESPPVGCNQTGTR